jgi:hypothetical protein
VEEDKSLHIKWSNFYLWGGVLLVAALAGAITQYQPILLFENFYRNGSLIFGGGQVLIPYLYAEFVDFKHFNGNLTHVNILNNSLNAFNLLPYYSHSTNDAYVETHVEHNFKGYIMNKIPLLNKLQWNLIGGFHQILIPNFKPYQELTVGFDNIGWGKFRFLRIDYVRSYQNGFRGDGVMFGIKL